MRDLCYCPNVSHVIYHLTCQEFMALADESRLRCMICAKPGHLSGPRRELLEVDHDHAVGGAAVRGLLCRSCNMRLRYVDDGFRKPTEREARYLAHPFYRHVKSGECPNWCRNARHGMNGRSTPDRRTPRHPRHDPKGYVGRGRFLWIMTDEIARMRGGGLIGDMHSVHPVWRIWNSAMACGKYHEETHLTAGRLGRAEQKDTDQ